MESVNFAWLRDHDQKLCRCGSSDRAGHFSVGADGAGGMYRIFYKVAAAVVEPVADKRIAGCLKGMAQGRMLYLKLMGYCVMLIF